MPATNISQCRALGDAVDNAVAAQLAQYGVEAYRPRSTDDLSDVFATPQFTKGGSTHLFRTPVGTLEFDLWTGCTLVIELSAPRLADPATPEGVRTLAGVYDVLGELAVRVEQAMAPFCLDELNARMPYHHLARLYPAGETRGLDTERGLDIHVLRYTCASGIKNDAWPTTPEAYQLAPIS